MVVSSAYFYLFSLSSSLYCFWFKFLPILHCCFIFIRLEGEDLHFFELNMSWKGSCYLFGVSGSTERRIWMQKILESLTAALPARLLADYTRAGWCYIKV
jgi:hypothetical protein